MNYLKTPTPIQTQASIDNIYSSTILLDYVPIEVKNVEKVRLSGPYSMFGPNTIIENVSGTTSFNQRTTEYIITYSKTNIPFPFVK